MHFELIGDTQNYWWAWIAIRFLVKWDSGVIKYSEMPMDWWWYLRNLFNPYIKRLVGIGFYSKGHAVKIRWK